MAKISYAARCHCGDVRFSFRSEPIVTGKRCNCSICVRKGIVMSSTYFPASDFDALEDLSVVSDYRWNDNVVNHLFCKTCGVSPYFGNDEYGYRVNLGCVEGLDVFELDIGVIDGRSLPVSG